MFDKTMTKIAAKMGKNVKTAIEPIHTEIKKTVDNRVDLYSKLAKLGVLIFVFVDVMRRVTNSDDGPSNVTTPSSIIINNYINRKDDE